MNQKKKKWRIALLIVLVLAIVASSVALVLYRIDKKKVLINLAEVHRGDVVKIFSTSAPIKSSSTSIFHAIDGVKVLELNVKEGDVVEAGTLLATFDSSSLAEKAEEMQRAAENARVAYDDAVRAAESAREALPAIIAEIEKLEKDAGSAPPPQQEAASFDIGSIIGSIGGLLGGGGMDLGAMMGDEFAAMSQLAQLQIQKIVLETQMSDSYLNSAKQKRDLAQKSLDVFNANLSLLQTGWIAESRGIVSKINIKEGMIFSSEDQGGGDSQFDLNAIMNMFSGDADITSLISMLTGMGDTSGAKDLATGIGMIVENYDEFYASISLGKYDMETVKKGQRALVSFVDREYVGEVTYISPIASASDSFNITSMMGGMAGSTNAAEGIVTIYNPDEGITLGFDADISIITDEAFDVLILPVESIRWTPEGDATVYVYNTKTKRVSFREIEVGISDSTGIEILGGLHEGDKVVRNVLSGSSKMLEDKIKVKLNDK